MGNIRGRLAITLLFICLGSATKVYASENSIAAKNGTYSEYVKSNYTVKDQGTLGTCWAFALTGAAEINLNKKGLTEGFLDLSESHLSYFFFHRMQDIWGRTKGDSVSYIGSNKAGYLTLGNNLDYAIKALANGVGFASESEGKYEDIMSSYKTYSALSTKQKIEAQMKDRVRLNNVEMVNPRNVSLVKKKLLEYGAASVSYYSGAKSYSARKSCYYSNVDYGTDHAVTLIGYDDSFSRNNFAVKPKKDGAWLVLSSWGKEFGQKGYAWISYEDVSLTDFAFLDVSLTDGSNIIYQYDGSSYSGEYYEEQKNPGTSNVYTSGTTPEVLNEVSFYTLVDDCNVKVEVYADYRGPNAKGTQVAVKTAAISSAGYHTVALSRSVYLKPNTKFAVVVTYLGRGNWIPIDVSYTEYMKGNTGIRFVATCNKGESYSIDQTGKWKESSNNFRIKAFTTPVQASEKTSIRYFDGTKLVMQEAVVKNGANYALKSYSKPGYLFEGWYLDDRFTKKASTVTLNRTSISLYAKLTPVVGKVAAIKAEKKTDNTIALSWSNAVRATEYEVYQYNEKKKAFERILTTKKNSCTIKKLKKNTTYRYKVCGKNGSIRGTMTQEVRATTTITTPALYTSKKGSTATIRIARNTNVTYAELYVKKGNDKYRLQKTLSVKSGKVMPAHLALAGKCNYKVKVRTYSILNGKKQYSGYSKEITVSKASRLTIEGK